MRIWHITLYSAWSNYNSADPEIKKRFKHIKVDNLIIGNTMIPPILQQTSQGVEYNGEVPNEISISAYSKITETTQFTYLMIDYSHSFSEG